MKFLWMGILMLAASLSAAEPAYYWHFDKADPKTGLHSSNGVNYHNALITEKGGINGTGGLLCNGTKRNHMVLNLDCEAWTVEMKFKLDPVESNAPRYLLAYEHTAWNQARFLLYIDANGKLTGDFRTMKDKKIEKQFVFASESRTWTPGQWYTLRVASKSGGPARMWLDGELVAGKDNALALSDLNDGENRKWYPQVTLGCNPADPAKIGSPLFGVIDDLKIWKSYEEPVQNSVAVVPSNYLLITDGGKQEWSAPFQVLDKETEVLGQYFRADDKFVKNAARAAVSLKGGQLQVSFQCPVPSGMELKQGPDDSIWKECVEFFFRPDAESPVYYQFAAGANGKFEAMRYSTIGSRDKTFQSQATCKATRSANGYTVEMQIPAAEIGLDKFESGMTATGNFTRQGDSCNGLSTWAPVGSSFHNPERFGRLILSSRQAYISRQIAQMKSELERLSAVGEAQAKLLRQLAELETLNANDPAVFAKIENALENLRKSMVSLQLAGRSSLLWKPDTWKNDIEVSMVSRPLEKIKLTAAMNSKTLYGFALSNLSDKPYLGQIKLFPGKYPSKTNQYSFSHDSTFHELFSNVKMREGIPQITTSGAILYDAMNSLPLNTLIRVAPKTTAPLWLELSTEGVPAGNYTGTLALKPAYTGFAGEQIPFELEVLPVDLGKVFVKNFNYSYLERQYTFVDDLRKPGMGSPFARFLVERGVNCVAMNIDVDYPEIDAQGNIGPMDFTSLDRRIDDFLTAGVPLDELSICFYLGWEHDWARLKSYRRLPKEPGKARQSERNVPACKFGTPEWDKAAGSVLKELVAHIQKKYKLPPERIVFYPIDEPFGKLDDPESRGNLAFRSGKLIKEAVPECRIMVNPFSKGLTHAEYLDTLKKYCELFDIIELYDTAVQPDTIKVVRDARRELWTYHILQKETSPETYRRIYWKNFRDGVDDVAAFWHIDGMAGGDGFDPYDSRPDGKNMTDYGTAYADFNFGEIMTGRRMEAHHQGLYDYKAAKLCRQLIEKRKDPEAQKKLDAIVDRALKGDCETMAQCRIELIRLAGTLQKQ